MHCVDASARIAKRLCHLPLYGFMDVVDGRRGACVANVLCEKVLAEVGESARLILNQ